MEILKLLAERINTFPLCQSAISFIGTREHARHVDHDRMAKIRCFPSHTTMHVSVPCHTYTVQYNDTLSK